MGRIFTIRVGSAVAGAATVIALAALGVGPMSLAIGNTVNTAATMLGARIFRPAWLPLLPSLRGVRRILTFSGQSLTSNLLLEASRAAPDAILGKAEGPSAVALFGRASGLVDVFARFMSQAMWSVTLPFFSKVKREGGEVGSALAQAQAYFLGVAWPFYAVLAFSAHPVMLTLFGDQWVASIPVLRWMTAFGAATATTLFASTALIAANHAAREVRMTAKVHVLRIAIVAATAPLGIVPLAMGLSAASIVEIVIVDSRDSAHAGHRSAHPRPDLCASGVPDRVERAASIRRRACTAHGCAALAGPAGACRCVGRGLAVGIISCSSPAGTGSGESGAALGGAARGNAGRHDRSGFRNARLRPTASGQSGRSRARTAPRADVEICARRSLRRGY